MSTGHLPSLQAPAGWEYKALFDATDEGFCILRIVFDASGAAVDAVFLEANPSFTRHTGLQDVVGRTSSAVMAAAGGYWLGVFGEVARTGNPMRISDRAEMLGRWFDVHAFRIGDPRQALVAVRFNDITESRQTQERLASVQRIKTVGVMFWGVGFDLIDMNDGFLSMMGYAREEALGLTWQELTPPEFHAASLQAVREVATLGESMPYEKQYIRKDGTRWWGLFAARRIGDEVVEFVQDVSERRRAEDALRESESRMRVMVGELQHRTRNLVGVVMAMMDRTAVPGQSLEEFRASFGDRLAALARVQGLLSRAAPGDSVTFDSLLQSELSAQSEDGGTVALAGPSDVVLRSNAVQALAMALHELTTNAVKYGALGQPSGRLDVRWRVERESGSPWIFIDWKESGVETAEPVGQRGAGNGRRLIEDALPYQFGARTSFAIEPDGVRCTIALPLTGPQNEEMQDGGFSAS